MNRGTLTVVAQATLVSVLVAGVAVFVGLQKTVVLSVDGQQRTVHTYARTVGDVLEHEKVAVAEHDTVVPSQRRARSASGSYVSMRRGRELVLSIDGATRPVWTTAQDVNEALGQLGLHATDAYVSVSRSGRIPLQGVDVTIRTPHRVTVLVDGKRIIAHLDRADGRRRCCARPKVTVGARDIVSRRRRSCTRSTATPSPSSRVSGKRLVEQVAIPFKTIRAPTRTCTRATRTVKREGEPGLVVKTYDVTYVDGKVSARKLVTTKKKEKPVTKIVVYGTQEACRQRRGAARQPAVRRRAELGRAREVRVRRPPERGRRRRAVLRALPVRPRHLARVGAAPATRSTRLAGRADHAREDALQRPRPRSPGRSAASTSDLPVLGQ